MSQRDLLTGAAFMVEGFMDAERNSSYITGYAYEMGGGGVETLDALTSHVPFMLHRAVLERAAHGSRYGVFNYEVAAPFGSWYYAQLVAQGALPVEAEAELWLKSAVLRFYTKDEEVPA